MADFEVRLESHIPETLEAFEQACVVALEAVGLLAEGNAKVEITNQKAIDTGHLRNSITHAVYAQHGNPVKEVQIGTNVHYGVYVEMGTGVFAPGGRKTPWVYKDSKGHWHQTNGMRPRPYLKPAVTKGNYLAQYNKAIKTYLENG